MPSNFRYQLLLFSVLLLARVPLPGQTPDTDAVGARSDFQFWLDYNLNYEIKDYMKLTGELSARTMYPESWYRGVAGMEFRWTPKRIHQRKANRQIFDITPGLRYFFTYNLKVDDIYEIRLHQDFRVSWPTYQRFRLVHRIRFEERFEEGIESNIHRFSARMRYRMGSNIQLRGSFLENFYIPAAAELFFNLESGLQFNDVFRARIGLGVFLGDHWRLEGLSAYHNVNNSVGGILKTHDMVFRFRIIHNLN